MDKGKRGVPAPYGAVGSRVKFKKKIRHFALRFPEGVNSAKVGLNFRPSRLWVALVSKEKFKTFVRNYRSTKFGTVWSGRLKTQDWKRLEGRTCKVGNEKVGTEVHAGVKICWNNSSAMHCSILLKSGLAIKAENDWWNGLPQVVMQR